MIKQLFPYFLVVSLSLLSFSCRQSKYVKDGDYLLKSNEVFFRVKKRSKVKLDTDHPLIDLDEVEELILPLLKNLAKDGDKREWIRWPGRTDILNAQIDKITAVTRGDF